MMVMLFGRTQRAPDPGSGVGGGRTGLRSPSGRLLGGGIKCPSGFGKMAIIWPYCAAPALPRNGHIEKPDGHDLAISFPARKMTILCKYCAEDIAIIWQHYANIHRIPVTGIPKVRRDMTIFCQDFANIPGPRPVPSAWDMATFCQ